MTKTTIRHAVIADCPRMLELIKELAIYEKAPDEVTVSLSEFEDAGFGTHPVWGAFVAEIDGEIVGISLYYTRYSVNYFLIRLWTMANSADFMGWYGRSWIGMSRL